MDFSSFYYFWNSSKWKSAPDSSQLLASIHASDYPSACVNGRANGTVLQVFHSYLPASVHLIIPVPAWMGEQMEPCSWYFTAACQYPCTWLSQCLLDWLRNWNRTPDSSYLLASTCASGFFSACANGQDVHENMLYQDVHENVLYQDVRHNVLYQDVH